MNADEVNPLRLAFLKSNWQGWEESERLFANITHKEKNGMHLYNYNKEGLVERNHPVLMRCRGLVVDIDGKVLNHPFEKFFNDFEKEKVELDWKTAEIQEKIDGSLICVFFANKEWQITTRGSFYPSEYDKTQAFDKWFKRLFKDFDCLNENYCYMFEMVTKKNRIVTFYENEFVVLIGARNLLSHKEISQRELDALARILNIRRPKRFYANNIEECKELFTKLREDEEGLVAVDEKFNRLKVKQESYFKLAKIKELNTKALFEYMVRRDKIDEEFLQKCPEVISKLEEMKVVWEKYCLEVRATFNKIKPLSEKSRKDFAMGAIDFPYKALLFGLLDNIPIEEIVNFNHVEWLFEKEGEQGI